MNLDTPTMQKVGNLLKIPHNKVSYQGCYGKDRIGFQVANYSPNGELLSGVAVVVDEAFKIHAVHRIHMIQTTGQRKNALQRIPLPFHRQVS